MLDALHSLMVTYEQDGAKAAHAWMARTGQRNSQQLKDLFTAALHAVPRARSGSQFACPEANALEGLRITIFDDIPAPRDAIVTAPIQRLFDEDHS